MPILELRDNTGFPDTYKEFMGKSTDQKPLSNMGVNSLFYELDTGKMYFWNGEEWEEAAGSGGGGGGDFSTAQVTVENDGSVPFPLATVLNVPDFGLSGSYGSTDGGDSPYTVILYKGKAYAPIDSSTVESISGDIEYDSYAGVYVITGDCTIMFNND